MSLGIVEGILVAGLVGAAVNDWQTGKIPNALTGPLLVIGMLASTLVGQGFLFALMGAGVGFAIHFPLWVLQVEKGGDAKLLIAAGSMLGWQGLIEITMATMVLYLPMAVVLLVSRGRLKNFFLHLRHLANKAMSLPTAKPTEVTVVVMGPLILVAGIVALTTDVFDLVAIAGS
jgi:Flp pilus assembly protein protease CpaA